MVARSSFFVLVALCLVSLAVAAPTCAYISLSEQVYDLRPFTGKGASSGDYQTSDGAGNKYYWNPCGVSSADTTLKTNSLVSVTGASVVGFRGDVSVTSFTETTVGDVQVTYTASGSTSNVHLVCVVGATPTLTFKSLVSSVLNLQFTYDCCAAGQAFVDNKCRGTNEANVCSTSSDSACNSQGKCLGNTAFGTCSCYPGFSGPQCANVPVVGYNPEVAEPNTVVFNPLLKLNLDSRAGVTILVPALTTRMLQILNKGMLPKPPSLLLEATKIAIILITPTGLLPNNSLTVDGSMFITTSSHTNFSLDVDSQNLQSQMLQDLKPTKTLFMLIDKSSFPLEKSQTNTQLEAGNLLSIFSSPRLFLSPAMFTLPTTLSQLSLELFTLTMIFQLQHGPLCSLHLSLHLIWSD